MEYQESFELIRHKYFSGVYSLKEMIEFVEKKWITAEQFHSITSYSYKGVTKKEGQPMLALRADGRI